MTSWFGSGGPPPILSRVRSPDSARTAATGVNAGRARRRGYDDRMSIDVTDAPGRERFEARDSADQAVAGFMTYQLTGNVIVFTHTEVSPAYEGQGVGSKLARTVMDDSRAKGRTVVPMCPFLAGWLEKHPEYADITAHGTKRIK
ncbi:hypothetical protein C8E86_1387 [Catellatospora citrea]|nr:hypothetical protein C8E86_1387 [Catellatospora citrea]